VRLANPQGTKHGTQYGKRIKCSFFLDAPGMLNLYYPIFPVRLGNHSELNMEPNTAKGLNAFFPGHTWNVKPTAQYFSVRLGNRQRTKHGTTDCKRIKNFFLDTSAML